MSSPFRGHDGRVGQELAGVAALAGLLLRLLGTAGGLSLRLLTLLLNPSLRGRRRPGGLMRSRSARSPLRRSLLRSGPGRASLRRAGWVAAEAGADTVTAVPL